MTQPNPVVRATRRRALLVSGVVPLTCALVGSALMISWIPELPNPIAVHWGVSGRPDGFASVWLNILVLPALVLVSSASALRAAWKPTSSGLLNANLKGGLATVTAMGGFLGVLFTGTVAAQRGLSDAHAAGGVGRVLLLAAAVGLVLGVTSWLLLPRTDPNESTGETPRALPLAADERIYWSGRTRGSIVVPLVLLVFILLGVALGLATSAFVWSPWALLVLIAALLVVAAFSSWRVTADRRGIIARSRVGWPSVRIPLEDIREVHVVRVNPLPEFGGWGWRFTLRGRSGIVTSAGEAIEVTRTNGKRFVVTVDDAATGASVLASVARPRPA